MPLKDLRLKVSSARSVHALTATAGRHPGREELGLRQTWAKATTAPGSEDWGSEEHGRPPAGPREGGAVTVRAPPGVRMRQTQRPPGTSVPSVLTVRVNWVVLQPLPAPKPQGFGLYGMTILLSHVLPRTK